MAVAILACGQASAAPSAMPQEPSRAAASATATVESTRGETSSPLNVTVTGAQGLDLIGTYTPAGEAAAPAVLLLHMYGTDRRSWQPLVEGLAAAGIASLAIDLRGHGDTGGSEDWELAQQDVAAAFEWLRTNPDVDPSRVGVVGASIGANLALVQAASHPDDVAAAALLSPGMDYFRVKIEGLAQAASGVPLFLAASEDDRYSAETVRSLAGEAPGEHTPTVFDGASHGTDMFASHPELADQLIRFLLEAFSL
jgi:pimeloyl-ACP methyl ester carboxylesterase